MTSSSSEPGGNIFEAARDTVTVLVLAMAEIKTMPLVAADCSVIAEALVDRLELADVHALAESRNRDVLDEIVFQTDLCLGRLHALPAGQDIGATGADRLSADQRLRDVIKDVLAGQQGDRPAR